MSSKHNYCSSGDSSSFDSYSDSSSSSSDYHSKHKRKKHRSKHHKHKHKEKKRHKKHKKEKKSKHHKKSKSKTKHKHSKKRHRNQNKSNSLTKEQQPKHKKRKLNNNKTDHYTQQKMITNAKSVLNMFCDNDQTKQFMTNIFTKLDNNESISISNQNLEYQKPLKMIFTFLSLHSNDQIHYIRNDKSISLLSMFKSELKTPVPTIKTLKNTNFIGPIMPPSNPIIQTSDIKSSDNSEFIGVAMPTNDDLLNNKYSSEGEEDDDYGPDVVNGNDNKRYLQMTHTKIYNEMSKKIKGEQVLDNSNNKREEWITTMPDSFLSDFDKAKNRAFSMNSNEQKMDKTWMETPDDLIKERKEKKRIMRIHKDTNKKLKKIGLPTVKQHNKNTLEVEENVNNNRDVMEKEKDNDNGQRRSLFEVHQEKLMLEYKEELKAWKRKKKKGKKVGAKPVFKGAIRYDSNASYGGRMENYYNAQNPTFTRSKLNTFVSAGTMDDY